MMDDDDAERRMDGWDGWMDDDSPDADGWMDDDDDEMDGWMMVMDG